MSFDIKFSRQNYKERRIGEVSRESTTCFWLSLINLISKDTICVIVHHYKISWRKDSQTNEKQNKFFSNLLYAL